MPTMFGGHTKTQPRLLYCLGECGYIASGALCQVKIYRIKPDLHKVNRSENLTGDPHQNPDQHQNLTTSTVPPPLPCLPCLTTSTVPPPLPCLPCLVDICYPAHRQNKWMTDKPKQSHNSTLVE